MKQIISRIRAFKLSEFTIPLALLFLSVLSYGILIKNLGFYWDDWPINWIAQKLGTQGLARYFSTNRPYWGMIYQLTTQILGEKPFIWHIFAIFWRWTAGISLWLILRKTFPRHSEIAVWAAFLFLVYPGFRQQQISLVYSHFFIVLTAFLLSLLLTLTAIGKRCQFWQLTIPALLLSFVNLITMEYFFLLELVRPILIWQGIKKQDTDNSTSLNRVFTLWLPYFLLFICVGLWRAFFFPYQTTNYQPSILAGLISNPLKAIGQLLSTILRDIWLTGIAAWGKAFEFPHAAEFGVRSTMLYWLTIAATSIGIFVYLLRLFNQHKNGRPINKYHAAWLNIGLGLVLLLLAGWPFWLTDISLGLEFPADRFTISFMLGSSILIAGLLYAIPIRNWVKYLLLAVLVGFAAGKQMEASIYYTRDWNIQKNFFWQLTWRMPQLKPGTVIVANDLPFRYTTDNSLSGPLNYIFAPDNHSDKMDYILYYPTLRLGSGLPRLVKDQPIKQNYLAAYFEGNTSQLVAIYYDYETCLRVLDPEVDPNNWLIPDLMRSAAKISAYDVILPLDDSQAALPPMNIYGEEPPHQWCYYLQKADLARQQGQWEEVARLGDEAFSLGDYPNGPSERIPFIEGYAHVGNWEKAIELTRITNDISPLMKKSLCPLWQRIEDEVPNSPEKTSTIIIVSSELGCE